MKPKRNEEYIFIDLPKKIYFTPTLRENTSLHDLIKDCQNKNQVNCNCVKIKNLLETTKGSHQKKCPKEIKKIMDFFHNLGQFFFDGSPKNKFLCNCVKALLGNKAVQNTFSCAFPILRSIFQKIWIRLQDEVLLGSRNIRSPRRIFF